LNYDAVYVLIYDLISCYCQHLSIALLRFSKYFIFNKDNDGLSVICSTVAAASLESISGKQLLISPHVWRAFVINVAESATEFPGAVHYLADSLSNAGLSILHISTFEYEVFLVQEQDIEKACAVFRLSDSPTKLASVIQEAQRKRAVALNGSSATGNSIPDNLESSERSENPQ
jgi:hypothetical protein